MNPFNDLKYSAFKNYQIGYKDLRDKYPYTFRYDYTTAENSTRKIAVGVDDRRKFLDIYQHKYTGPKTFYEEIYPNRPVAEYYDIDVPLHQPLTDEKLAAQSLDYIHHILECRNRIAHPIDFTDFIILQSHSSKKLSLHLISKTTYFLNNEIQGAFAIQLNSMLRDLQIDKNVYKKYQLFRLLHSHKLGIGVPLEYYTRISKPADDICETLISLDNVGNRTLVSFTPSRIHDTPIIYDDSLSIFNMKELLEQFPHYTYDAEKEIFNRIDQGVELPCIVNRNPEIRHARISAYVDSRNGTKKLKCFSEKCPGKTVFKILETVDSTKKSAKNFIPNKVQHSIESSVVQNPDVYKKLIESNRIIIDISPTGDGKTTRAINYVKSNNFKCAAIHHRISLDDDYQLKGFVSYKKKKRAQNTKLLESIVVNSLGSKENLEFAQSANVIILDEFRGILKAELMMKKDSFTRGQKQKEYTSDGSGTRGIAALVHLLEHHPRIIIMDANLSESDIEFIQSFSNDTIPIIGKDWSESKHICMVMKERKYDKNLILDMWSRNNFVHNPMIFLYNTSVRNMESTVLTLKEIQRDHGLSCNILHINAKTRDETLHKFKEKPEAYNCVFISPTIAEGVSFEQDCFRNWTQFAYYCTSSAPADSCAQQMRRFRKCEKSFLYIKHSGEAISSDIPDWSDVCKYLSDREFALNSVDNQFQFVTLKDKTRDIFIKNRQERKYLTGAYFRNSILQFLVNNEFILEEDTSEICPMSDEEEKLAEQMLITVNVQDREYIINANDIDSKTAQTYESKKSELTVTEWRELYKYKLKTQLHITQITHENIQDWPYTNIYKTHLLKSCIKDDPDEPLDPLQERMYSDLELLSNMIDFADQSTLLFSNIYKRHVLSTLVKKLGFSKLGDPAICNLNINHCLEFIKNPSEISNTAQLLNVRIDTLEKLTSDTLVDFISSQIQPIYGVKIYNTDVNKYCQGCDLQIRLVPSNDPSQASLFSELEQSTVEAYNHFFTKGNRHTKICSECDMEVKYGVDIKHIYSQKHIAKTQGLVCDKCKIYKTNDPSHLIRHEKTCKPKKSYRCEFCEYTAPDNYKLKRHVQRIHTE